MFCYETAGGLMFYVEVHSFLLGIVTGLAAAFVAVGFTAALFASKGADAVGRGLSNRPNYRDLYGPETPAAEGRTTPAPSPRSPRPAAGPKVR